MVTKIGPGNTNTYYGKSTDTKPTDDLVPNASKFYCFDNQKVFVFDADTKSWVEQ